jgi:hypothetical protein
MNSSVKSYKISVNSLHFGNMRGISAMDVSKKAAKKILSSSKLYSVKILVTEIKTGKIYNYSASKENLVRPYYKNGKLIEYRFIVKKDNKKSSGGGNSNKYTHYLDLLFEHDVVAFIDYITRINLNELEQGLVRFGLFNNPSRVATRICEIYNAINVEDKTQNIQRFLDWLNGTFMPILQRIVPKIPTIINDVNMHLRERCGKNLDEIITHLTSICRNREVSS